MVVVAVLASLSSSIVSSREEKEKTKRRQRERELSLSQKKKAQNFSPPAAGETPDPG